MNASRQLRVVDSYALSPMQEGMLFHDLVEEGTGVDLEQIVCTIRGPFDERRFLDAFETVVRRHPILRTRFSYDSAGRPTQEIVEEVEISFEHVDVGGSSSSFQELLGRDRAQPIDLGSAPAMRLLVVDWSADEHRVVWTFHHALLDGRSFPLVLREVFALYDAADDAPDLPMPRPYREYIEFLRGLDVAASEDYWRRRLSGFTSPTSLGIDRATSGEDLQGPVQGVSERRLPARTTATLRDFARSQGVTLNTLLQAAWALVLHRYSREDDVVFGVTRACRSAFEDADEMVGLFVNTLPFRVSVDPDDPLAELLKELRAQQLELRDYEHTPLAEVQRWSDIPRGEPLFDSILVYENRTLGETLRSLDPEGSRLAFSYHGQTNYSLTLVAYGDEEMLVRLENDRRRVDDAAASRMLDHVVTILTAMPGRADVELHELPLLTDEELAALVAAAPAPASTSDARCLHERFRERVETHPERVALVCDEESLTYGELDRRANALAVRLQELGVGPDVLVGLRCERSLELVVGLLGILKAGGAYLPLDPAYPAERVEFMVADAGVSVIVTESAFVADLAGAQTELVLLDRDRQELAEGPLSDVGPDDLAYVMYTSGSTGRPKGVEISHRNVSRLFEATDAWFGFGEEDVWTLFHSYAFDFSVWELWGALLYGGRLVVVPYWVSRSPEDFRELVLQEGVTVLNQTPSAFRQFVAADLQAHAPAQSALRYVIFGGEALEFSSLQPWFERHGDSEPRLVNMYGITETTVHVTYRPLSLDDLAAGSVIGVPIPDLRVLLLDPHGSPVPVGVAGEIYVGGAGLARGYRNRPELTAERFVADPFGAGTLYRSGDLARRLESGELEYLGRIDDQVKIRGFRIELGEIAALLSEHPGVREAAVVVREDVRDDKRLVAYVVASGEEESLVESLRTHLQARLPAYMVPAHIVALERLPLTANGKLDREALPAPDAARPDRADTYLVPRTRTEEILAEVWSDVLGVSPVGVADNFFELGGDSILTIQVIARCRQAGLRFTPLDLARRPTIAELAEVVGPTAAESTVDRRPRTGPTPLTPVQRWFFELQLADPDHWNQAFLFEVPPGLDLDVLQRALDHVVASHDALRVRVAWHDGEPALRHDPDAGAPPIARIDLGEVPPEGHAARIQAAATAAQAALDLERGPLLSAVYADRGTAPGRLLLVVHHLAVDGVSWRILLEDLEGAYRALLREAPIQLPAATASFGDWAYALVDFADKGGLDESAARWLEIEAGDPSLPPSATDGSSTEESTRSVTVSLGRVETEALLQRVPAAYGTQINDVLLTALALALREWTGRDAHRIDMEGHGREEWIGSVDVSRTVGWFTTLYPLLLDLPSSSDVGAALKHVKESLRRVPDRGLSYGVLRYLTPERGRHSAPRQPAELLFNYLGQFDQVLAGSELFGFADEPCGDWHGGANERTHRLEVLAVVRGGRFEAKWSFSGEREDREVVERLAEGFVAALRTLIEHCLTPSASQYVPSDFPLAHLDQSTLDGLLASRPDTEDVYPLSPMQQLFLSVEGSSSGVGFEQWVFRLRGPVDVRALHAAWESTVARHQILRTAFVTEGLGEPLQVVQRRVGLDWAEVDWSAREQADEEADLQEFLRSDRQHGFDIAVAPLSRVTLIRRSEGEHELVWSTHHLYVDGWSWPLILRNVGTNYEAQLQGRSARLAEPAQYRDYVEWLATAAPDSRDFWRERLAGFVSPTPLPVAAAPGPEQPGVHEAREATSLVDAGTTADLQRVVRDLRVTLNVLVQGAWAILLGHLSDGDDVVFGAAFSGRPAELPGVETLVGPCVNNLPVRVSLQAERPVSGWLSDLHRTNLELGQHQYASLVDIQEWAGIPWRLRLFDSLVVFQNYQVDDDVLRWGELELEPTLAPDETAYPGTLTVTPRDEIELKLSSSGGLIPRETLSTMAEGLSTLLSGLADRPGSTVAELAALLPASTRGSAVAAPSEPRRDSGPYVAPSNEMEHKVAAVWADLFQVERVGLDENFFDLGGHSILLVQAHARLRSTVKSDLPVVALLQYPTVRTLAAYLANGESSRSTVGAARDRATLHRQALARQRRIRETT